MSLTVRRRLALLLFVTLLAIGPAGAEGPRLPGAAATAWGIKVSVPNQSGTATTTVVSPPNGTPAVEKFAYPSDGSIVAADSSTATGNGRSFWWRQASRYGVGSTAPS
jgi:hypothetical protein